MRFFEHAGAAETLRDALTVMAIVFAVLAALFLVLKALTLLLGLFARKKRPSQSETPAEARAEAASDATLLLTGVDEQTAAMVMAIVADESGIPPERLVFRSIQLSSEGE